MRNRLLHFFLIATCVQVAAVTVAAQDVLYDPLSARVAAMSFTGTADNSNPSTIFLNPANVVGAPRLYAQGAMLDYNFDSGDYWFRRANLGASFHVGSSDQVSLGFDAAYAKMHWSSSYEYIGSSTLNADLFSIAAGAGFVSGRDEFLAGMAVKRYTEDRQSAYDFLPLETTSYKADATAFDVGFQYRHHATVQGWDVTPAAGVAMTNAGEDIDRPDGPDHFPRQYNLGVSTRMASPPVTVFSASVPLLAWCVNLDASQPRDDDWNWMAGMEVAVAQMFFLRSGLQTFTGDPQPDPALSSWGAGVGIPAGKFRARFDYGRRGEALAKFERFELTLEWTL